MRWLVRGALLFVGLLVLLVAVGGVIVSRRAIAPAPPEASLSVAGEAPWFPKEKHGVNHVFLSGNPFARGFHFGRATKHLLERQEDALMAKFEEFFPYSSLRSLFVLLAKSWFYDIDTEIGEEWRREMHGVSLSAPRKYDHVADGYTRQLAYHGLHEAGQAFVDYGEEGFGCTVLAVPQAREKRRQWLVGRNFDFEGGRIFDEEKILKWVFPENGIPFVSVSWAGMVGVVTGVNREGVYLSLNAAGSRDFSRLGTPTTLVLLEALQYSATAEEAVERIRKARTVITKIFVVTGPGAPLYVVEKSPGRVFVKEHREAVAVANHLEDPAWKGDSINDYRRDQLTSAARKARGTEIVNELAGWAKINELDMVAGLRDKLVGGKSRPGHRSAIDALIATHAVVYDSGKKVLHVSEGPSLSGKFRGFDLERSFAKRVPVETGGVAQDEEVPPAAYAKIRSDLASYLAVLKEPGKAHCSFAEQAGAEHYLGHFARAVVAERCGRGEEAVRHWRAGLALSPAYARERKLAEERLQGAQ